MLKQFVTEDAKTVYYRSIIKVCNTWQLLVFNREAFSMTTAMPQKTLLKNKYLCSCDHFAVIPFCLHSTILTKNATTRLVH